MARLGWRAAAATTVAALFLGLGTPHATAQNKPAQKASAKADAKQTKNDILIFKDGQTLEGVITHETNTTVRLKGSKYGIPFEMDYQRGEIIEIKRNAGAAINAPEAASAEPETPAATPPDAGDVPVGERVYYLELTGKFGEDITQTPLRAAMKDAKSQKASTIIILLDNQVIDLEQARGNEELENLHDGGLNEIFRAEKIMPVITDEAPVEWGKDNLPAPKFVYWVRRALGGICFLPLTTRDVYFHPEGKLGGVGNLNDLRKMGHIRVTEKQISLRRQHCVGWVNMSGYPQAEELVRALMQDDYVMSVRMVNGKPELFEGLPSNPGEELLTDDGQDGNADTIEQLARGEGNDVLTLNERTAKLIGVSRGTVETKSDLLVALGFRPEQIVKGRSEQVMRDWTRGLESAKSQVVKLWEEYREIRVEGDYDQRHAARAAQISKLEQIKGLFTRYYEAYNARWLRRNGFPIDGEGGPGIATITELQDRARTGQMLDKRK